MDTVGSNSGGVLAQCARRRRRQRRHGVVGQLTASGAGAGGVAVGVGGSGGSGGTGGAVDARIEGNVHTRGAQSMGVVAQSLGGGGGNGGLAVSGVLTASGRRAARWPWVSAVRVATAVLRHASMPISSAT